ncbi:hypothetical protein GCM10028818_46500 [Spirosoma horti]
MFSLLSNLTVSLLLSATTLTNPTHPKALSFDASAYVTVDKRIRVSVQKTTDVRVLVLLRDKDNEVLFRQYISKKESKYMVKLNVNELSDGQYDLEFSSKDGSIRKQVSLSTALKDETSRIIAMQ